MKSEKSYLPYFGNESGREEPHLLEILLPLWPRIAGKSIAKHSQPVLFACRRADPQHRLRHLGHATTAHDGGNSRRDKRLPGSTDCEKAANQDGDSAACFLPHIPRAEPLHPCCPWWNKAMDTASIA